MTNTGDKIFKVVNKTRKTVRFNSVLVFYPGKPLRVTERLIKSYPAIGILLKRGDFEVLGEDTPAQAEQAEQAEPAKQDDMQAETQAEGKEPAPKKRAKRGPKTDK